MSQLYIDLYDLFGQSTAERGLDYFFQNKVVSVELEEYYDEPGGQLTGQVRGQKGKLYQVTVDLGAFDNDPDEDPLAGYCTCPMTPNCKHVCALLLAGEKVFGAEKINQLLDVSAETMNEVRQLKELFIEEVRQQLRGSFTDFEIDSITGDIERQIQAQGLKPGASTKQSQKSALETERRGWLNHLQSVVERPPAAKVETESRARATNCVVYILEEEYSGGDIIAQPYLSRYLKKGGFGKPKIYTNARSCLEYNNWPASMDGNDKHIFKLAYLHDHLNIYESEISLKGQEGYELLQKILETGRCLLDENRRIPVTKGSMVQGEIRWQLDEKGLQRPFLFNAKTDQQLQLLLTEPPSYLSILREGAECGELTKVPEAEVLNAILAAPPLDEAGVEETARTLKRLFKGKERKVLQMPRKVETLTAEPEPLLILDGIHWSPSQSEQGDFYQYSKKPATSLLDDTSEAMARARLFFSYNGNEVLFGSPLDTIRPVDDDHRVIPRQRQLESRLFDMLPAALHPAYLNSMQGGALAEHDLVMGMPGADYQRHWLHFMAEDAAELEEKGWTIKLDDSFPFQFETLSESDWYAELDESDLEWFTLRLGINIDGKSIDLLPLLARQINHLPDPEQLQRMDKNTPVPIALPGGKYVTLPAERLRLILATLLELFGDRPLNEYRLQPHHAEIWEELYNELDLPWAGGEKLLELGRKLKSFKKLKKVKPANTLQAELRPYQQHGLSWLQFLREYGLNGITG